MQNKPGSRLTSIDALRGTVMVLMALDHVRDFFHIGAASFSPTDLEKTNTVLFLTRWVTHFCLPVFMFTAGIGSYLWWQQRHHTTGELSRFLWTRGLWFVLIELTLMQVAYDFNFPWRFSILLVILWIFGICMIAMAGLVYLRTGWLLAGSMVIIALHNCLDRFNASEFGSASWAWNLLHQPGVVQFAGHPFLVPYTFFPWIAVMAAGFCFGRIFEWTPAARQRLMVRIGTAAILLFVLIRGLNRYGDPASWAFQKTAVFTVLSFLNCTKYPASLDFLLMTLGPALLLLAFLDRHPAALNNPVVIFGRVPFFYFVIHFYLIHGLLVIMSFVRYGSAGVHFVFNPTPSMGGPAKLFPPNFGYSLPVTYLVWLIVVTSLYPVCRWYARIKATRRSGWLSYL